MPLIARICRRTLVAGFAALAALAMAPQAAAAKTGLSAERASYVLFVPGSQSSTMSGSMDDLRRARALRAGNEGLLYVAFGGAAYVIRDPATLRQAKAIFAPQEALGRVQAQLGSRQAELGSRQARLGAQQARLGARQADASPRLALELGRQQTALGRQQDALGRQQDALGRQQGALGREQERLAHAAEEQFRALLADALRRGLARRVR